MKGLFSLVKKTSQAQLLAAVFALLMLLGLIPKLGPALEDPVQRAASLGTPAHATAVTIVAVDRRSIVELGPWPWGQDVFAKIMDQLRLTNAKLVVLDGEVTAALDASTARRFQESDNRRFISYGFEFYPALADLPVDYEKTADAAARAAEGVALPAQPRDDSTLPAMSGVNNATINREGFAADGFLNIFPDGDGVVRSHNLAARLGHRIYPALALAASARAGGFTPLISEDAAGKTAGINIGERTVSTGPDGSLGIDFAGCSADRTLVSAMDVAAGDADVEKISEKIVLLGVTEPTIAAMYKTPLGRMSAAEIQACAMGQLMDSSPFRSFAAQPWTSIAIAAAALLYFAILMRFSMKRRTLLVFGVAIASLAASAALVSSVALLLPSMHFAAALVALLAASWIWNLFALELPAKRRSAQFCMRLSQHSLKAALSTGRAFEPEGRPCEIAAYAIDIRGFGSIAASLEPRLLCSFMRKFRNTVSRPLLEGGAFIESWSSDECRASFGALVADENKAHSACRAAIATQHAISAAREDTAKRYGIERLSIGIGIWQGRAAAGELGPAGAAGFGVVGVAMESAAILRTLNRTYRTSVIVNDDVRKLCERSFRFRPLDLIMAAGDKPTLIHELVGEVGVIMPQLPKYLAARASYMQGDFERAAHLFAELLQSHPHDGPSQLFLNRAKFLIKSPPRAEWLGVWPHQ